MEYAFAIAGLFVGGLMNAVSDRVPPLNPEYDGPFITDRARSLKWWEYLPFLSFLGARQAPRMQIANRSWRYLALEIATAGAFWLSAARFEDNTAVMIAVALFAASLEVSPARLVRSAFLKNHVQVMEDDFLQRPLQQAHLFIQGDQRIEIRLE